MKNSNALPKTHRRRAKSRAKKPAGLIGPARTEPVQPFPKRQSEAICESEMKRGFVRRALMTQGHLERVEIAIDIIGPYLHL